MLENSVLPLFISWGMMCSRNVHDWSKAAVVAGWLSAQVSDYQEHEDAGQQHASNHDELILGGSPFYQSHHCVRQP